MQLHPFQQECDHEYETFSSVDLCIHKLLQCVYFWFAIHNAAHSVSAWLSWWNDSRWEPNARLPDSFFILGDVDTDNLLVWSSILQFLVYLFFKGRIVKVNF